MIDGYSVLERYKILSETEKQAVSDVLAQHEDLSLELPCLSDRQNLVNLKARNTAPRPSLGAFSKLLQEGRRANPDIFHKEKFGTLISQILGISGISANDEQSLRGELAPVKVNSCSEAEGYFTSTRKQIIDSASERELKYFANQCSVSVLHDKNGMPLVLRKAYESISAINLVPISVGEVSIPKGTIIGFVPLNLEDKTGTHVIPAQKNGFNESIVYTTYEVDSIRFAPSRATPWVHEDKQDKALFGCSQDIYDISVFDHKRAEMVSSITLDDFKNAAHLVLSMCGIEK